MIKPVTGQYECLHRSILKLDYFTSRLDRLTLYPDGRFLHITQERSRLANAAQSLASGQQASITAPEIRREGTYSLQGPQLYLQFSDGTQQQGQIAPDGEGLQIGQDFFNKVSASTMLPPTNRLKKDMDDIAKGIKIAGTIGGMALKAAKLVQDTLQTPQEQAGGSGTNTGMQQPGPGAVTRQPPAQPMQPMQQQPIQSQPAPAPQAPQPQATSYGVSQGAGTETLYCDQCGVRARPGKKFCNNCGARLP